MNDLQTEAKRAWSRKFQELAEMRRRNGIPMTVRWVGRRLAQRLLRVAVANVLWLDVGAFRGSFQLDADFTARFLTPEEIRAHAVDPGNDLFPAMADRVAVGQDLCLAILDGQRLAAYSWFAPACIEAEHNFGLAMSYPPHVACYYKGFTHVDYRGRRLNSQAMGLAFERLRAQGIRQLVATVEWTNVASLKSCFRLGYIDLGHIVMVGWGRRRSFCPAAARELQIRFGPDADLSSRHL